MKIDIIWNYGSLAFSTLCALSANLYIVSHHGPEGTGIMGIVYAVLLISGQMGVFGIQYSVLATVARRGNVSAALICVSMVSILIGGIMGLMKTDWIRIGWCVPFFAMNKVLLNSLIGMGRMRRYAVGQGFRGITLLLSMIVLCRQSATYSSIATAFLVTESIVTVFLLILQRLEVAKTWPDGWRGLRRQMLDHYEFGLRAFLSGFLLELHIRFDVLILAWLLPLEQVGVYVLAAMFIEGYFMVLFVLRNVLSPQVAAAVRIRAGFRRLFKQRWPTNLLIMLSAYLLVLLGLILMGKWFPMSRDFSESIGLVAIVDLGILISSAVFVFDTALIHAGHPGVYSLILGVMFLTNVTFNLSIVPVMGLMGAACAAGASYLVGAIVLTCVMIRLNYYSKSNSPVSSSPPQEVFP